MLILNFAPVSVEHHSLHQNKATVRLRGWNGGRRSGRGTSRYVQRSYFQDSFKTFCGNRMPLGHPAVPEKLYREQESWRQWKGKVHTSWSTGTSAFFCDAAQLHLFLHQYCSISTSFFASFQTPLLLQPWGTVSWKRWSFHLLPNFRYAG